MLGYYSYYVLAIATLIGVSFGLLLYVWHWNRANAISLIWTPVENLPHYFVPKGVWGPDDVSYQSSFFFNDFRETQRTFRMWQLLFSHTIALTTSIETHSVGACHAQVGVCCPSRMDDLLTRKKLPNAVADPKLHTHPHISQLLMIFLQSRSSPKRLCP